MSTHFRDSRQTNEIRDDTDDENEELLSLPQLFRPLVNARSDETFHRAELDDVKVVHMKTTKFRGEYASARWCIK